MLLLAKRRRTWSEEKIKRYIKEGRGIGTGRAYKPWINNQSFPSEGRTSRISGWKTHRVHHLASDNETRYFYLLEWSDIVIDIREQYPLIAYDETVNISKNLGIKHPRDSESGVPYVLSTDFLVTIKVNGKESYLARTIKPASILDEPRVIEKFEIERRYWEKRKVDWAIVTERDIPIELARNIEWVHASYNLEDSYELSKEQIKIIAALIKEKAMNSDLTFIEIADHIDSEMNLDKGTGLSIIKHLLAKKEILIDMHKKINLRQPARLIIKTFKDKAEEIVI